MSSSPTPPAGPIDEPAPWSRRALIVAVGAVVVAGVFARAWPRSALWLDEAQSVSFARLPIVRIPGALREDGAPPLYYVLLHVWMRVFGDSDNAVRAMSVVFSVLTLVPLTFAAGKLAGRRAALATLVLVASSPFAIRYGSETRMYALVMLEASLGLLLLVTMGRSPTMWQLAGLSAVVAALLYTHYWSIYLVTAVSLVLVWRAWRERRVPEGRTAAPVLGAIAVGFLVWLPWIATFLFQSRHTGTPWTRPADFDEILHSAGLQFGGAGRLLPLLAVLMVVLGALGACFAWGRRSSGRGVTGPGLAFVVLCSCVLAVIAGMASHSAYRSRYTAVVFPPAFVLAGIGATVARRRGARLAIAGILAAATVAGLMLSLQEVGSDRTRAPVLVDALASQLSPSDVIVYCPDQLGPAANRVLSQRGLHPQQLVFPGVSTPNRVDWIDYQRRYVNSNADDYVESVNARFRTSTIWVIWSGTYPPTQASCSALLDSLQRMRPSYAQIVPDDQSIADHGALWEFRPRHAGVAVS